MENKKDNISRNKPTEKGRNDDPGLRDKSAAQPGVSTMSSSDTDEANEHITKTTSDHNRKESAEDQKADREFDDQ